METNPFTPVKRPGNKAPVTPALTRAESAGSPATPATPAVHAEPPTPTPVATFVKGPLKSSLKHSTAEKPKKADDELDIEIPPWDRTAELVWTKGIATSDNKLWDDELSFQENSVRMAASDARLRPSKLDQSATSRAKRMSLISPQISSEEPRERRDISGKDNGLYFKLPDRVRLKIAKRIVAVHSSGKPIRLNHPVHFRPIWPVNTPPGKPELPFWTVEYFDSLESVLYQLARYLSVCFAMRIDFLTTLFLTRRFHIIYSPMIRPITSPLATKYMDKYGVYMKWINLEIDLTKYGGNFHPAAANMGFLLPTIRSCVEKFVEGQLSRRGGTTLQSLIIMVRRYHGVRPDTEGLASEAKPIAELVDKRTSAEIVHPASDRGKVAALNLARITGGGKPGSNKENIITQNVGVSGGDRDGGLGTDVTEPSTSKPPGKSKRKKGKARNSRSGSEPSSIQEKTELGESKKSEEGRPTIGDPEEETPAEKPPSEPSSSKDGIVQKKADENKTDTTAHKVVEKLAEDAAVGESKAEPESGKTTTDKNQREPGEPKDKGKGVMKIESEKDLFATANNAGRDKEPTRTPLSTAPTPMKGTPFCPDENLSVLDPLQRLGIAGLVDNLCLVGASKSYANNFIEAFLTRGQIEDRKERQRFCHFRNPPRAYPLTPGQRSAIDRNGAAQILVHETDPLKWQGLYGAGVTEHWKKFDAGPFNFKPAPVKVAKVEEPPAPSTPRPKTPVTEEPDDSKEHKRRFSTSSRTNHRRLSSSSLLQLITRTSTSTTRPGSVFGFGGGDKNSSSSSIPPLTPEPPSSPRPPSPSQNALPPSPGVDKKTDKRRSRRMSFIFHSKIPVLSKKHKLSPPVFRSSFPFSRKTPEEKRPKTPISLPYDKGHLVSGNRPVSGHRYGLTRIKDTVMRKVDEVMAGGSGGGTSSGGGVETRSRGASMSVRGSVLLGSSRRATTSASTLPGSAPTAASVTHRRRVSTSATGAATRGDPRRGTAASVTHGRRGSTSTTGTVRQLSSRGSVTTSNPASGTHGARAGASARGGIGLGSSRGSGTIVGSGSRGPGSVRGGSLSSGSGTITPRGGLSVGDNRTLRVVASERGSLRPGGPSGARTLRGVASERGSLRGPSTNLRTIPGSGVGIEAESTTSTATETPAARVAEPGTSASPATPTQTAAGTSKGKGKEVDRGPEGGECK